MTEFFSSRFDILEGKSKQKYINSTLKENFYNKNQINDFSYYE